MNRALILVDLQNDFCPGGALAVANGDEVVSIANQLIAGDSYNIIIATQDWHPQTHGSFASNNSKKPFEMGELGGLPQVMWPDHCVQGTKGAELRSDLNLHGVTIFRKGTDRTIDSYSAFYDNGRKKATGLTKYLGDLRVTHVDIMGLATDYCVKATVLDAINDGFDVQLIERGCRGVNMNPDDSKNAIEVMRSAGAGII